MDDGHKLTEQQLQALEKRITAIYREAQKSLEKTIKEYFDSFRVRDERMKHLIGTEQNERIWTEQDYIQWRLAQIGRGARFQAMRDQIAERLTNVRETTMAYINGATPGIYALNYNFGTYTIEQIAGSVGLTLLDETTVQRLVTQAPELMPNYPEERAVKRGIDLEWGKKQIEKSVTSGILRGLGVGTIAKELQTSVTGMSYSSAIRTARTAITSAQNAGRLDSYDAAAKMGIDLKKEWIATLDGRTRHSHRRLDGEVVDYDKPFSNGCQYPGDPRGKPAEVYNCRCTLVARVKGVDASDTRRKARDPKTGKSVLVSHMTYEEWEKWVQSHTYHDIIGKRTSNGIEIKMISAHSVDRGDERGVTSSAVLNAVTKPLYIREVKVDNNGQKSQRFIGRDATVNINPDTGNIVTVWRTGSRERKRYGGE